MLVLAIKKCIKYKICCNSKVQWCTMPRDRKVKVGQQNHCINPIIAGAAVMLHCFTPEKHEYGPLPWCTHEIFLIVKLSIFFLDCSFTLRATASCTPMDYLFNMQPSCYGENLRHHHFSTEN